MKMILKAVSMLGFFAAMAHAEDSFAATCDTNSCTGNIKRLVVYNTTTNGVHQVQLDQNVAPAGTCTLGSGKYWAIRQTDQDLLKLVIAAQLANKPITLRFDTTQTTCTIWYAYVE